MLIDSGWNGKQEIQLSLTNHATHLCKPKTRPPSIGYHAEFSRSALKDVDWNSALLRWEAWLTQDTRPSRHLLPRQV